MTSQPGRFWSDCVNQHLAPDPFGAWVQMKVYEQENRKEIIFTADFTEP
jgi:hypothetical protein